MKNQKFNLKNYLFNLVVVLFVAALFMPITPLMVIGSAGVAFVSGTLLSYVPTFNLSMMAIQVEIWQKHIEEEIFKDNAFLRYSFNADANVINSRAVHIPQSGGSGNVVKNRSTLPATIRKRTDTDVVYLLDEFTTDPVLIPNADTHELSYDKRNSVLGEDRDKLVQAIAEETIYSWLKSPAYNSYGATSLPTANVLETSGTSVAASAPSATGTRKAATLTDLQKMQSFFRKANKWHEGKMYAMLTPGMLLEMFPADSIVTATYMQNLTEAERREGVIMKAQGFNIISRSSVARVQTDGTIIPYDAVGTTTDDEASLFWYKDAVEYAFGGVEAFEDLKNPQMYGDVYSFLARSGARARRVNYEGIALLKQAKTA